MEDSLTSGRISVVVPEEARKLAEREVEEFRRSHPESGFELKFATSRDAIASLLDATAQVAWVSRELEPEERAAAVRGRIELEGFRIARDAITVIVHPSNPVENLGLDDLRRIYSAAAARWSSFGGPERAIVPVLPPVNGDLAIAFSQQVMGSEPVTAPSQPGANDSATVAFVAAHPGAIGFVSLAAVGGTVKPLRLSALAGLPAVRADAQTVHEGRYPLTRGYNLYVRSQGARLAHGWVTFVTSQDGQRLVHEAGLVPTGVPLRFVHRSPMQSTH